MKLYDVYDGSRYIGELTLAEISELTGKTRSQISQAISGSYMMGNKQSHTQTRMIAGC